MAAVQSILAKVAPVTRIDSPSAMMMNRPQRSAICAPSTSQSAVVERPRPGVQKPSDRRHIFDGERQRPEREPQLSVRKRAGDPEQRRQQQPGGDALEIAVIAAHRCGRSAHSMNRLTGRPASAHKRRQSRRRATRTHPGSKSTARGRPASARTARCGPAWSAGRASWWPRRCRSTPTRPPSAAKRSAARPQTLK